jgi:outer membrane protein assembly factor BamD (BamD/ComL family)
VGSLRAERLLVETASAALTRGDYASAIASLRKHARAFPHGELTQEREVLMVQALRASGDDAAAQQRAKDFKQKFPGSVQQGTVDKASPE